MGRIKQKLPEILKRYRYGVLVFLLGLVLMAIPGREKQMQQQAAAPPQTVPGESMEEALEALLSQIHGAGRVEVLLSVANGRETVYQTDEDGSTDTVRRDTVTVTDGARNQTGLVRQVNPPGYRGAVVVCQGGDSAAVCLAIIDAVSKVTGLSADRISVLKMK